MKPLRRFFRNSFERLRIAGGLLVFLWRRKVWWMIPLVAVLLVLSVLVMFGQSSAISALLYSIF